jgi:indole-3-glycerol phosphate synthase
MPKREVSNFLEEIIHRKKREVERLPHPVTFKDALKKPGLSVIAEVKRKSPSKGILSPSVDPVALARKYVAGGASAISVLTDEEGFGGTLQDLRAVVEACPGTPVLRKDFIIDIRQIYETARTGAHAVLLIASLLGDRLSQFIKIVGSYGMQALVEVHDIDELYLADIAEASIIGVNNRNLCTFEVSLNTAGLLAPHFSENIVRVAESGIENGKHAAMMQRAGYDAILVGEALIKAEHPEALIKEFKAC